MQASVCFNVGLGYLRFRENKLAKSWLTKSLHLRPDDLKTRSYLEKVNAVLGEEGRVVYSDVSPDTDYDADDTIIESVS